MHGSRYHNDQLDQEPIAYRIFSWIEPILKTSGVPKDESDLIRTITKVIGLPVIFMKMHQSHRPLWKRPSLKIQIETKNLELKLS